MLTLILNKLHPKGSLIILTLSSFLCIFMVMNGSALAATATTQNQAAANCKSDFFGLIPWYGYFPDSAFPPTTDANGNVISKCNVNLSLVNSKDGTINTTNLNSIWLIALALFEDLLVIVGMLAIGFIIYGGIRYTTSQGEPENTKAAYETILNALIGAAIAAIAAVTISFIGNKLGGG